MFDTIKLTSLVQKMLSGDPCFLPAEELLRMAVQEGIPDDKQIFRSKVLLLCTSCYYTVSRPLFQLYR